MTDKKQTQVYLKISNLKKVKENKIAVTEAVNAIIENPILFNEMLKYVKKSEDEFLSRNYNFRVTSKMYNFLNTKDKRLNSDRKEKVREKISELMKLEETKSEK